MVNISTRSRKQRQVKASVNVGSDGLRAVIAHMECEVTTACMEQKQTEVEEAAQVSKELSLGCVRPPTGPLGAGTLNVPLHVRLLEKKPFR